MASNASVTLDTIVIDIESSAGKSTKNLVNLTKTLIDLKSALKGGFRGLNNLSNSLQTLNKVSSKLPKTVESLSGLSKISRLFKNLSAIEKPLGVSNAIKNISQIPDVFNKIDTRTLENVARVSSTLANALTPLANKMADIGYGFTKIELLANRYGVSVTKIREKMKSTGKETDKFSQGLKRVARRFQETKRASDNFGKAGIKTFQKLQSKIKQVALSLLGTRTLFTAVRKAVSEYSQMDEELTKTTQNLWRALGAQLAPAIEYVLYLFKQIVRVIYSVVYALTGIDLIARANEKALTSMGKAAKDALGSLQKFDDLNVAEFDKGSGDTPQIELEKIDLTPIQEVINWMRKLKAEIENAWKTGEWGGVFNVLYEGLLGIINAVPWYDIGVKIREAIEAVDWKAVWTAVYNVFKESFNGLGEFINGLVGADENSDFGSDLLKSFLEIYATIQLIRGANGFLGIMKDIGLITDAPSVATLCGKFGGLLILTLSIGEGIDSWKTYLSDPTSQNKMRAIFDTLLTISGVVAGIAILFGAWPVALIAAGVMIALLIGKFLAENWEKITKWFSNLGKSISTWFSNTWQDIKKWWNDKKEDAKKAASKLGKSMGDGIKSGIVGAINGIIDGWNWLKKQLNKFKLNVPDWVPEIGGKEFGFNFAMSDHIKLETGTNEIEYEGLYHLHEGEAVVPKKYNPALGNGTDEELGQKLDTLIGIMNTMNFTNVVNIGNKTLYKEQQRYNKMQNDKYGTTVNL